MADILYPHVLSLFTMIKIRTPQIKLTYIHLLFLEYDPIARIQILLKNHLLQEPDKQDFSQNFCFLFWWKLPIIDQFENARSYTGVTFTHAYRTQEHRWLISVKLLTIAKFSLCRILPFIDQCAPHQPGNILGVANRVRVCHGYACIWAQMTTLQARSEEARCESCKLFLSQECTLRRSPASSQPTKPSWKATVE